VETDDCPEEVRTALSTWVVDRCRRRFRSVPSGRDPADPRPPADWVPYHGAWRDPRTGALTLMLDPLGTRLLRIVP
jgi:hypothetical protein